MEIIARATIEDTQWYPDIRISVDELVQCAVAPYDPNGGESFEIRRPFIPEDMAGDVPGSQPSTYLLR